MIINETSVTSTTKTISNIRKTLKYSLEHKYGIKDISVTDNLLKIHGLHKDSFDVIANMDRALVERLNDFSMDDNSNKDEKTIEGLMSELSVPIKKAIGYDHLYQTMKVMYGKKEAKRLMGEMLDYSLGLADSSSILNPYCYNFDASKLNIIGRDFGVLKSKPSKRITSYTSALCETIHQLSSHLSGAVAVGSFFLDVSYLLLYKEKYTLSQIQEDDKVRKYIENEYQQLIHSLCHLSRGGQQSPFSNLSVFDRVKLKTLISKGNYDWYFERLKELIPKRSVWSKRLEKEDSDLVIEEYIIEYIIEVQNIFLDFFDKGDPMSDGLPYRFPVCSVNLSKKKYGDRYIVGDNDFLKSICKRDIFRYNIFCSEGTKICSCCRLQSSSEMLELASQSNSFGGVSIAMGSHRVITINFMRLALESNFIKEFYKIFKNRIDSSAKILYAHKELIKQLANKGLQPFITNGWINMNRLFSTVGILGIVECAELLKKKFKIKVDVIKHMLVYLNKRVNELTKEYENKIIMNIEQIPAESFAKRLPIADKLIYSDDKIDYILYANQFVPLWQEATIWEKFEIDGKYNQLITGGGIVHGTIGEKLTALQAEKIIKYAVDAGAEHFALNTVYSLCDKEHTSLGKLTICPKCGEPITDYMTRVVGFFVKVSNWNKERREWEFDKRHIMKNKDLEKVEDGKK